jgi:polyisoprenoid-binding protein YceI
MKIITSFLILLMASWSFKTSTPPITVNKAESSVTWHASKVTGAHFGNVPISEAKLDYTNGKITGGSFEMDMTNLTVEDLKDEKSKGNLTNHLKSDDFFSVAKFPKATMKITNVKTTDGKAYSITADLTIKGVTVPVTFPATVAMVDGKLIANAEIKFDRTKYDIKFRSGNYFEDLADKLIYDEVKLDVKLVATP